MENKNISQIAFDRIKEKGIKPISSRVFNAKRILFWAVVVLSLFVGAFTFSIILSAIFNNDWDLYSRYGFNFILKTVPYFWLVFLGIFAMLGEFYYRKTSLGHRYHLALIVGIYMSFTIFFGLIFYSIGVDELTENFIVSKTSLLNHLIYNKYEVWSHPEDGLLSGTITQVSDGQIEIMDFSGSIWIVNIKDSYINEKTLIEVGSSVKIFGDPTTNNVFNADEVRLWNVKGMKVR